MEVFEVLKSIRIHYPIFGIIFLTSGLLINFTQLLLRLLLMPVNKDLFRKINYFMTYSLHSQLVFLQQYWANVKVRIHVKKEDYDKYFGKEHGFLIMNHSYEIDWLIGWILCENIGVLGNCKAFAKKELQYLPTLGFTWKLSDTIFLERDHKKDQEIVEKSIRELVAYNEPFWLLLTAEGTRFTKEKHEASKTFAKEHGLPVLQHHLTPRTKGFTFSVPLLRKRVPAIYNIIVGVKPDGVSPTLSNILLGKSISASLFVERIPMSGLPEDEKGLSTWLHNLYKQKDELLDNYLKTGNWLKNSDHNYQSFIMPRRIFPALNVGIWCVTILVPLGYHLLKLLISGHIIYFSIIIASLSFFTLVLDKLVAETQISKASSYGISKVSASESQVKN